MWTINLGDGKTYTTETLEDIDLDEEEVFFEGERLTNTRAEEIAREISRRNGLKGGRPPKTDAERASVHKAIRLTIDEADRLVAVARARGVRETDVIRRGLLRELEAA